jgi:phospholipid/cholesterol/gamma-HCH transport system permease protein
MAPLANADAWQLETTDGGVRVAGRLKTRDAPGFVGAVLDVITRLEAPTIDLTGVEQLDGGVVALLRAALGERAPRAHLLVGGRFEPLLDLYAAAGPPPPCGVAAPPGILANIGRAAAQHLALLTAVVAFTGEMATAVGRLVRRPRGTQWADIPHLVERAGADALPITLVINFLVGLVLAYMGGRALQAFGANRYVADLVGIGMARQLGPLMTAIVVCGRSAAAYTTELGSMRVDQEIDALRTLGLEPFGWLVVPRLLSLVAVVPVLTLLADLAGVLGGLPVAVASLGLTARGYVGELRASLTPWDVESGIVMSVAFAIAMGLIACERGFTARGGAEGVGKQTTSTVVTSLFAFVVLDAGITVLYRSVGLE